MGNFVKTDPGIRAGMFKMNKVEGHKWVNAGDRYDLRVNAVVN
ncbi:hypothetical protein [Nostoc sp. NMS9]|nr:hypothetical protein [Nostoc sp. NMS9]